MWSENIHRLTRKRDHDIYWQSILVFFVADKILIQLPGNSKSPLLSLYIIQSWLVSCCDQYLDTISSQSGRVSRTDDYHYHRKKSWWAVMCPPPPAPAGWSRGDFVARRIRTPGEARQRVPCDSGQARIAVELGRGSKGDRRRNRSAVVLRRMSE